MTALGRSIHSAASAKHSINRIDRLQGNPHLYSRRVGSVTFKRTPSDTEPCCHRSGSVKRSEGGRRMISPSQCCTGPDWSECAWLIVQGAANSEGPLQRLDSAAAHSAILSHQFTFGITHILLHQWLFVAARYRNSTRQAMMKSS